MKALPRPLPGLLLGLLLSLVPAGVHSPNVTPESVLLQAASSH